MKDFVPYEKMSKKQKREQDKKKRGTWTLSPVTRIADTDKKKYSRKTKHKNSGGDDSLPLFFVIRAAAVSAASDRPRRACCLHSDHPPASP